MHSSRSAFFELSPDMLAVVNENGQLLDVNSKWQSTLGWTSTQFRFGSIYSKIFEADRENFKSMLERARENREESICECRFYHNDTSTRIVACKANINPVDGSFFLIAHDRTKAQATRQSLDTVNRQIEALFSSLVEGVMVQNVAGRILQSNHAILQLFGVEASEIIGYFSFDAKWCANFEDGRPVTIDSHPAMRAQKTGKAQTNCKMQIRRPSGEKRWVNVSANPLFEVGSTKPNQVVITIHDITDERDSQRALAQKEREVSALMSRLPAMVTYWDSELKNGFSNNAVASTYGKTPAEIVGLHAREVWGEENYSQDLPFALKALSGAAQSFESTHITLAGETRQVIVSYIPNTQEGETFGFYSIVTDVSKMKKLELERRDLESKVIAGAKMSALGEMAAGIAHEINNPLAIINGKTDLLRSRIEKGLFDPVRFHRDLTSISGTVERIAKTVRGLLAFSRNRETDQMRLVSIETVIQGTIDLCREKIRNRGINLQIEVDPAIVIECRENQISQIVMNLVNNACDAIEDDETPWLTIVATVQNGDLELRVTDSGAAIPDHVVDKIMNPFFTTKEIGKGTGLGLSISKGLAESHGGHLILERTRANTCFLLKIPLSAARSFVAPHHTQQTG